MALFEVVLPLNRQALTWVNIMVEMGAITDAIVGGLTTVAGLRAITAPVFETQRRFYEAFQKAVDRAQAIGTLVNSGIAGAGNVAGLRALFVAQDSSLAAAAHGSMVLP